MPNFFQLLSVSKICVRLASQLVFGLLALLIIFSIAPALAQSTPTISPQSAIYPSPANGSAFPVSVSISATTGTIYYTTDGTDPTTSATAVQYTSSISVSTTTQIRAAAKLGSTWSSVANSVQVFDGRIVNVNLANMVLWLTGSTAFASNGTVNFWADLSMNPVSGAGNHNDVTQNTTANQPAIVASGVNGLPAVNFRLSGSNFMTIPSLSAFSAASIFIVTAPNTVSSNYQIINLCGSPTLDGSIGLSINASNEAQFFVYNSSGASPTAVAQTTAMALQPQLIEGIQGGTSATFYTNGFANGTSSSMNAIPNLTRANNFIGQLASGGSYYDGQISEIIIYSAQLTQAQQSAVESYLIQKYQTATAVPTAPIISVPTSTLTTPTYVAIAGQANSTIYYTLDGTTPTTASPVYTGPINVYYSLTLKSIAVSNGLQSTASSATYTLNSGQWPAPGAGGPTLQINPTLPTTVIP